jgi:hypothetical protein
MPDDAPTPPPAPQPCAGDTPYARQVAARYLDACARGLARDAAMREAAALLWALRPSLSPRQASEMAADIVASAAS